MILYAQVDRGFFHLNSGHEHSQHLKGGSQNLSLSAEGPQDCNFAPQSVCGYSMLEDSIIHNQHLDDHEYGRIRSSKGNLYLIDE